MFGKLLKHEIKATSRVFLMMYVILIFLGMMPVAGNMLHLQFIENIGMFAFTIAMTIAAICYIVTIVQRYHNSLYGDEGYLTFTLPVRTWQLLAVKLISATFWAIISSLVSLFVMALLMLLYNVNAIHFFEFMGEFWNIVKHELPLFWMTFGIILISGITVVMRIYMSVTVANLPFIQRGKTVVSIVVFFLFSYIQDEILTVFVRHMDYPIELSEGAQSLSQALMSSPVQGYYLQYIAFSAIFIALMFYITNLILSKKLCLS